MTTDYDKIAKEYQESKLQPWRTHIERYTLLSLAGRVQGLQTLDLACGEGYYTRLLRRLGADPITGVDLSNGMIELALSQEATSPLGIQYCVGDARAINFCATSDFVFAAYLLNYASNYAELLSMCEAIARNLKPGGRFLTVNNNPDDPPSNFETGRIYGYSKRLQGCLEEGAPIIWTFHLPEGAVEVTNYYLSTVSLERAMHAAGMTNIHWHKPQVSPEGLRQWGESYWREFLSNPPVTFFECTKR
jgi:ubiquinone/menaquinone biosynthesis C-methylase UbiE